VSARCPQCSSPRSLEPLEDRYAAELGGITCQYLLCPDCRTISREVRTIERLLGTAVLIPMLGVAAGGGAVGCYLWALLAMHGRFPTGFLMTTFALQAGAAFATSAIFRKLALLHSRPHIIPIGELREG
jgi:hypothetical protein